jgi:hypothetical protein
MRIGKELEAQYVQRGRLSCESDVLQVGSARSHSTRVVRVNRRKTNRRKTIPYCISASALYFTCLHNYTLYLGYARWRSG